jgi:hypothetical protein
MYHLSDLYKMQSNKICLCGVNLEDIALLQVFQSKSCRIKTNPFRQFPLCLFLQLAKISTIQGFAAITTPRRLALKYDRVSSDNFLAPCLHNMDFLQIL